MKPLHHPSVEEMTVEGVLYAFADPARAEIFAELVRAENPQNCSIFLQVRKVKLPKSTLSKHFAVLREAGLIRSVRKGVELLNSSRCSEIRERFGPMIKGVLDAYQEQFERAEKETEKKEKPGRTSAKSSSR